MEQTFTLKQIAQALDGEGEVVGNRVLRNLGAEINSSVTYKVEVTASYDVEITYEGIDALLKGDGDAEELAYDIVADLSMGFDGSTEITNTVIVEREEVN